MQDAAKLYTELLREHYPKESTSLDAHRGRKFFLSAASLRRMKASSPQKAKRKLTESDDVTITGAQPATPFKKSKFHAATATSQTPSSCFHPVVDGILPTYDHNGHANTIDWVVHNVDEIGTKVSNVEAKVFEVQHSLTCE